jgi:hypothetical protein
MKKTIFALLLGASILTVLKGYLAKLLSTYVLDNNIDILLKSTLLI